MSSRHVPEIRLAEWDEWILSREPEPWCGTEPCPARDGKSLCWPDMDRVCLFCHKEIPDVLPDL
jgi:hypothetical protein